MSLPSGLFPALRWKTMKHTIFYHNAIIGISKLKKQALS